MADQPTVSKTKFSADWLLQGVLTKIGDTFDKLTGRKWTPSSSLATSELIERMKRLLDAEAKKIPGKGTVVPHNIKLKMQWDKFSSDADDSLAKLENEMLIAAADYVNDSLYYTFAPLKLEVKPDYFTEGIKLLVSFDTFSDEEHQAEMNVTVPVIAAQKPIALPPQKPATAGEVFIAHFALLGSPRDRRLQFPATGRLSVGRTSANDLMIDDISVSKIHASLVVDAEAVLSVADTGSTNGTFINGQRISYGTAARLESGDKVKFGVVEVLFEHIPLAEPEIDQPVNDTMTDNTVQVGDFEFSSRIPAEPDDTINVSDFQDKTFEITPLEDEKTEVAPRPDASE